MLRRLPPLALLPRLVTDAARVGDMRRAFPGYGNAFLPSLVLAASDIVQGPDPRGGRGEGASSGRPAHSREASGTARGPRADEGGTTAEEQMYRLCVEGLLRVATPEVMCRLAGVSSSGQADPRAEGPRQKDCKVDELRHAAGEAPVRLTWRYDRLQAL